jgi:hypothetical protein
MDKPPGGRKPRSPIKNFLRPRAGATLRDQLVDAMFPVFFATFGVVGLTAGVAVVAAVHWLNPGQTSTAAAITLVVGWAACGGVVWWSWRRIAGLRTGLTGELDVAQTLDELRECGYQILHSIDCGTFDIDHVVVGPSGV